MGKIGTRTGRACLFADYGIWATGIAQICSISMNRIANMGKVLGPDCSQGKFTSAAIVLRLSNNSHTCKLHS